ncbi:uncharacterized protein [Henckelia pumila]|uniref:uncharacterized protein isoform X2 n=1 Tax=Henckelia pumila TaxID=405737 RepID=UPI003C6DC4F4
MTAVTFTSALKYNKFMGPAPGATSFPQVILTAATFNVSLFEAIGRVIFFSFFFTAQGVHLQKKEKGACAGALFIMSGETETGELHLGKFKWGHAFLSLNRMQGRILRLYMQLYIGLSRWKLNNNTDWDTSGC